MAAACCGSGLSGDQRRDPARGARERLLWRHRRPAPLEASVPGVFAVDDVRAGSVKRVGAAIGVGAAVVAQLHAHLAAQRLLHQRR